jgi:hypothetical protein
MRKNIIIFILAVTLAIVTYSYINTRYRISVLQKKLDEQNTDVKSRITLYESEDKIFYHLLSNDNKLFISFTYDEQGLKESFSVVDDLSGKRIGFNFYTGGELTSLLYEDNQYTLITNTYLTSVFAVNYPERFIERIERINGLETNYTLFSDGTTDIKIESEMEGVGDPIGN